VPSHRRGPRALPPERLWTYCRRRRGGHLDAVGLSLVDGYPVLSVNGRNVRAHRLAWELTYGPIPFGMLVTHTCDRRVCCAIAHLRLGTKLTNAREAVERGRTARGERNGNARLTARAVRWIRRSYRRGVVRYIDLAEPLGVTAATCGNIVRGETWRHLLKAAA
jgi:hypothetical protein